VSPEERTTPPRGFTAYQLALVGLCAALWAVFAVNPQTRQNWLLENALVAAFASTSPVTPSGVRPGYAGAFVMTARRSSR